MSGNAGGGASPTGTGPTGTGLIGAGAGGPLPGASPGIERSLLDDCVHCGFCLPACPTYVSWSEEMDSPRGRIDLMRGLAEGSIALTDSVVAHFDRCLGCMGCMPACPSGVRYDVLIEETRASIERSYRRPLAERIHRALPFALFPYPRRLRVIARILAFYRASGIQHLVRRSGILRVLPRRLAQLESLAPPASDASGVVLPERVAATGLRRARVGLVAGCVQRVFFPGVNAATLRVLSAEGCEVWIPPDQGCCGALSMHAGREDEGLDFARRLIASFETRPVPVDAILVNAAGCGSNLKDYGRLLAADPQWADRAARFSGLVRDISEYLAPMPPVAPRHPLPLRVAYHDACHLAHAQKIRSEPRELLRGIPELTLVEIAEGDSCCGSAGVYNLVQPESADEIGARKADQVRAANADLMASANPGCTLQIQKMLRLSGAGLPAAHPIEILDASISGSGLEALVPVPSPPR